MKRRITVITFCAFIAALCAQSCRMQQKVASIREEEMNVSLQLPPDMQIQMREIDTMRRESPDTIVVNFEGRDMLIMKAVKDDETGEMIANEELKAAVITARFRNIAERHGKVDIEFEILVPDRIQDSDWQLRFQPSMYILEDTTYLDRVYVTGPDYRRLQLRGYEQYERFISRIITDTTRFINLRDLEIFLQRNIPQVYMFRNDSSYVTDEEFASYCGVSEREAIDHYTSQGMIRANERRKGRREQMYARYVKAPIETENIRIDTVLVPGSGDLIYRYVETIATRPKLRKVEVVVDGDIYRQSSLVYDMPPTEPLTFYISSLATFVDPVTRYMTEVRHRRAEASAAWNIDFRVNRSDIDLELGDNARDDGAAPDHGGSRIVQQQIDGHDLEVKDDIAVFVEHEFRHVPVGTDRHVLIELQRGLRVRRERRNRLNCLGNGRIGLRFLVNSHQFSAVFSSVSSQHLNLVAKVLLILTFYFKRSRQSGRAYV